MRACPRCGTSNDDAAKACVACGMPFEGNPKPGLKQTMLGMAPGPVVPAVGQAPPPMSPAVANRSPVGLGGTMLGMQTPFSPTPAPTTPRLPDPPPVADSGKKAGLQRTMLGFGGPAAPAPAPVQDAAGASRPQDSFRTQPGFAGPAPGPHPSNQFGGTVPVLEGPGHTAVVPAYQPATGPMPTPGFQGGTVPMPVVAGAPSVGEKRTMLGVALPGIAPLHPGQPGRPTPTAEEAPPTPRGPSSYPPPDANDLPAPPVYGQAPSRKARTPTSAILLIAVALVLLVGGVIAVVLWKSPKAISAEVELDDQGNEVLALKCDDCADGATATLGSSMATFGGHRALLTLAKPLELGKNDLRLSAKRSASGKLEEVSVSVAVDYRVNGDLSALSQDPASAKVVAEAVPGSAVVVDGHALALDAGGRAECAVDVSHDLEGPSDTVAPFERRIPYTVTPPGGKPHQGQVTLKFGIVPLRVDAPGAAIVIDGENFMLAGRTLKDGRILVSGRPITVDGSGRFAQLMNVSREGETTISVRADATDYAPRIVHVRVKRVARLSDEAAAFRETALTDYSSIGDANAKKGQSVALEGEVVEARLDGEVTVLLLDVRRGCPAAPCLARVVFGGRFDIRRGSTVTAYGQIERAVDGPRTGVKIPEVAALFLLRGKLK